MKLMIHDYVSRSAGESTKEFDRWQTLIHTLRPLAAAWLAVFLLSSEAFPATFRFASSSNRIYVEGGGSATLSNIKAALPNAPLDLVDPANAVWLLRANLFIADGSVIVFHGTAIGGDVNEFRLQSNNSSATNSFVSVTADYGGIDIASTRILSWDLAANGPDTEFQTYGRAFMRVRSRLAADGVTPQESRMDILDSDISYLGYDAAESYGLTWKVSGSHPDPNKSIFDYVNVYGDIKNSRLHDSFWGTYTFGAYGCQWLNNEVDHNAGYGFDPHDDSDNLLIEDNNVHHNGLIGRGHHGIIASRRCDHIVIRNNRSWANGGNGIMLHRHSDDALVEHNETFQNADSGIAIFDSDRATIRNNLVISNFNAGMRFSVGASDNVVLDNEVGYSGKYGFYLYAGDDPAEPDDTDPVVSARPRRNGFSNNLVHHSTGDSVHLGDADDNTYNMTSISPGPTTLSFENASNIVLTANSFPANATVRLNGASTNSTTMSLKNHPLVQLEIDAFSTATFEDDAGAIFDLDQGNLATSVDSSGSVLSVTLAALGAQTATVTTTVVTRNFLVAPDSGTVLINPTLWELSGGLRKAWTTEPVDNGTSGGPTPTAVSATANVQYTVGDLAPNTSYVVSKNGQALSVVTSDSGGHVSFADVPGTTGTVQYAVAVNDQPPTTVTVAATDANASETGPDSGTFTISRTGATTAGLTVRYSLGGTAVNGTDYASLSGTLTIPAGAASATVTVTPIDDTAVEGNETVILTVSADAAYTVGSPNSTTVTIADNDQVAVPTVTVTATDANASETGPDAGTFTMSRTGDTTAGLTVRYSLGGTATNGTDYASLSGSVTIPAGAASATVAVTPIDDTTVEGNETVILTLSADAAYTVGSPNNATVTIADNDQVSLPTLTVAATDANASETGPDSGTFTVSRTGATTAGLTVRYSLGGTAANGTDYTSLSGSVTIPAGAASASVTVAPINDTTVEGNETVILTVSADTAYTVGLPNNATVTIVDNDQTPPPTSTVTVVATDANAAEKGPDPGTFTISRSGSTTTALTVNYSLGGTAINGVDYESLSGSVTIPAGAASANIVVRPIDDKIVEVAELVTLTLISDTAYTVGPLAIAVITIVDNDLLVLGNGLSTDTR
jgi:parallel beta-helix repeat protein